MLWFVDRDVKKGSGGMVEGNNGVKLVDLGERVEWRSTRCVMFANIDVKERSRWNGREAEWGQVS